MEAAGIMPTSPHTAADEPHGQRDNLDAPPPPRNLKESSELRRVLDNLINGTVRDNAETYRRLEWVKARVKHLENVLAGPQRPAPEHA